MQNWKFPYKVKPSEAYSRSLDMKFPWRKKKEKTELHTIQGLRHVWYFQKNEYNKNAFHKLLDAVLPSEVIISGYGHQKKVCTNNIMLLNSAFILQCISTWWRSLQLSLTTSCRLLPSDTYSAQKPHFCGTFALIKSKAVVFQGTKHGLQDLSSWTLSKQPWVYNLATPSPYMKWGWLHSWVVSLCFPYCTLCVKIIFHLIDK